MGPRERTVRKYAGRLLVELDVTGPPVDPEVLAEAKGIRFDEIAGFPAGIYGVFYQDAKGFGVLVSANCFGSGHRSFTIAHELGHYHIDGHVDQMFASGQGQVPSLGGHFRSRKDPLEREADWFAAELLMPGKWAKDLIEGMAPEVDGIRSLQQTFGTSLSCAAVRFAELTQHAAAVILSHEGQVEWVALSGRLREHRWARRSWKREFVPEGTASRALSRDEMAVGKSETVDGAGLLCEWFEGAPAEVEVDEEALGLGRYGRVLTVLSANALPSPEAISEEESRTKWRERDWRDAIRGYSLD